MSTRARTGRCIARVMPIMTCVTGRQRIRSADTAALHSLALVQEVRPNCRTAGAAGQAVKCGPCPPGSSRAPAARAAAGSLPVWLQRSSARCLRWVKASAELLFQVLTERDERSAIAIAANQPASGRTKTFTAPRLCTAIAGRLTFAGQIIETGTTSYRLAHARDPAGPATQSK